MCSGRVRFSTESSCKVMTEEYDDMSDLFEKRKKEIGETAELVSTTTSAYLHNDKLGGLCLGLRKEAARCKCEVLGGVPKVTICCRSGCKKYTACGRDAFEASCDEEKA